MATLTEQRAKQLRLAPKGGPDSIYPFITILDRIMKFKIVQGEHDLTKGYERDWNRPLSATTMPPSPGVQASRILAEVRDGKLWYSVDHELRSNYIEFLKWQRTNQPEQIRHRSRMATLALSELRITEARLRAARASEAMTQIKKYIMPERIASTIKNILIDKLDKYTTYDEAWKNKYISERWTSSIGEGMQWNRFRVLDNNQWRTVMDAVKSQREYIMDEDKHGWSHGTQMYSGIRARSPGIEGDSLVHQEGEIDRSRIIGFHPALSTWTLFMPEKKRFYNETLTEIMSVFGLSDDVVTPIVDGGEVYVKMSERLANGDYLNCLDGKSWEQMVGIIMGEPFSTLFTRIYGFRTLPSGITLTSWLGTVCQLWMWSKASQPSNLVVVLGDDLNIASKGALGWSVPGVVEHAKADEAVQFMLGVSYLRDPYSPRTQGDKLMADRGDKVQHLNLSWQGIDETLVIGKHEERIVELWLGLNVGRFGPRSLISAIKGIPGHEFRGPGDMIQNLAEEGYERWGLKEILAWREALEHKGKNQMDS